MKLEKQKLHMVIAGLTKDTPWKSRKIRLTIPSYTDKKIKHIIAVQQGENRLVFYFEKYLLVNKDSINMMSILIIRWMNEQLLFQGT